MITSNQPKMSGPGVPLPTKIMVDSHDTKPTNVKNGAELKEIDTGKEFIYSEGTSSWDEQPRGSSGGGVTTLAGLTDVDITNPTDGQTLVYNVNSGKWENGAGGVLNVRVIVDELTETESLSETWQTIYDAISNGTFVYISSSYVAAQMSVQTQVMVNAAVHDGSTYKIQAIGIAGGNPALYEYEAASPNDYPVATD